ncbi:MULTISPECIES: potassium channel family protein [Flammeovirga]|uniref:Two pore domain potassium channel family protein n=1 Tax=Flammeovirga agarivorans TaxID=2726742 RepID=A0A7X8SN06_9BACT|nr:MULTISPECIES: potassium channel family protein [Flammeovirga]NLR93209.1 two pore domain potassium channel family protein [Flammeovirga agarivorans]
MILTIFRRFRLHRESEPYQWFKKVCLYTLGINILFAILFKYVESVSWNEAIWQTWQTATTVGYGNAPAETLAGRIITMVLSTISIAFVGALFSAAFDYKEYYKTQKKLGFMNNPYKDGYVIFHFPGTTVAKRFIHELREVEKNVGICFVDDNISELPDEIQNLPNIHFVKGCPLQRETYYSSGVKSNKTVIVFPTDYDQRTADGSTKTTIDLLERFIDHKKTRILYVLVDMNNGWMFENNNATYVNADLSVLAIVQECQDPYSALVIEDLLYNSQGANPMTVEVNKIAGLSWKQLQIGLIDCLDGTEHQCNLLSLIRNGQSNSCPKSTEILEKGDLLSISTFNGFPWTSVEEQILALQS